MMLFMPLVAVWIGQFCCDVIGQFCCDVIGHKNEKVVVLLLIFPTLLTLLLTLPTLLAVKFAELPSSEMHFKFVLIHILSPHSKILQ